MVFVPTSGCGEEIGSTREKKKKKKKKRKRKKEKHTHTGGNTVNTHITKQQHTLVLENALVTLMYTQI